MNDNIEVKLFVRSVKDGRAVIEIEVYHNDELVFIEQKTGWIKEVIWFDGGKRDDQP